MVGVTSIRAEVVAHVVPALDELGEVVDEVLDDALLVGHDSLVQRSVPIVVPGLQGVGTLFMSNIISCLNSALSMKICTLCTQCSQYSFSFT